MSNRSNVVLLMALKVVSRIETARRVDELQTKYAVIGLAGKTGLRAFAGCIQNKTVLKDVQRKLISWQGCTINAYGEDNAPVYIPENLKFNIVGNTIHVSWTKKPKQPIYSRRGQALLNHWE